MRLVPSPPGSVGADKNVCPGQKETEVVVKAVEKPTELLAGGDQLAAMLTAGMGM